eukprot:scaffold10209_cov68-Phaeocystis_antarctica.AAC.7
MACTQNRCDRLDRRQGPGGKTCLLIHIEYVWRNLVVDLPARSAGRLWAFLAPFAGRSGAYWEDLMQKYPNDIRAAPRRRRAAAAPRRARGH